MNTLKSIPLGLSVLAIAVCSLAGANAREGSSSSGVVYFDHEKVDAAFAKGGELLVGQAGHAEYKVVTARRDRPGEVEIHNLDTDIIFITSGTATFVTGGTAVAAKPTAPNEMRGRSIDGGASHHLSKGDLIIIPHGVPHWFTEVQAPFFYLVVKVR